MNGLDRNALYKIVLARDKRYDGRFYCGVHTTGIYCRPICPARPLLKNLSFYKSSTEAENAGFRACLRCRPEISPLSAQWQGTAAIVWRALTLLETENFERKNISEFAEKFGVSDRHLRRLFEEHLGASPMDIVLSKRLHLSKQLLVETALPITEIAHASGFKSIRRFNDAFKLKFESYPSKFRKLKPTQKQSYIEIDLPYISPFDWDFTYLFLKRHWVHGVEDFYEDKYYRVFSINGKEGFIEVSNNNKKNCLHLCISCEDVKNLRTIIEKTKNLFDLKLNPHQLFGDLSSKKKSPFENTGIRIPGAWDSFETAICIILGQLVSTEQAKEKVKKLILLCGETVKKPLHTNLSKIFPSPLRIINSDLKSVGLTKIRAQAMKDLAKEVLHGKIDLSPSADFSITRKKLLSIKGIGPWTAEMIAMRCLGDTNAFPKSDLIIKRAIENYNWNPDTWRPWSAYVTLFIWKKYAHLLSKKKVKTP